MGNFMDSLPTLEEISQHPDLLQAQATLAEILRTTPNERRILSSALYYDLYEELRAEQVFPGLEQGRPGEQTGMIDIRLRAPIHYGTGKLVSWAEYNDTKKQCVIEDIRIGTSRSAELLFGLPDEQRVAAITFAFVRRHAKLMVRHQRFLDHGDGAPVSNRMEQLEHQHFPAALALYVNGKHR